MMNKNLLVGLVAAVLLAGGLMVALNAITVNMPVPDAESTRSIQTTQPAQLVSSDKETITLREKNDSNQTGTATIFSREGRAVVKVDLDGAPAGVSQPAHIHQGRADSMGSVKFPLNSLMDGKSETTLPVSVEDLKDDLPLSINIHKSVGEENVVVAAGDLEF